MHAPGKLQRAVHRPEHNVQFFKIVEEILVSLRYGPRSKTISDVIYLVPCKRLRTAVRAHSILQFQALHDTSQTSYILVSDEIFETLILGDCKTNLLKDDWGGRLVEMATDKAEVLEIGKAKECDDFVPGFGRQCGYRLLLETVG